MLTCAYSWIFWLAPLPLIMRWLVPPRAQLQPAVRVPFLARVQAAGGGPSQEVSHGYAIPLLFRSFVWLLLLAAMARPQWLEPPIERSIPTRDLLLLVDLSGSMEQEDFTNAAGQSVDRLTAAKEVLGDFLARRDGDRVGLIVFGSAPFLQVPFTTDLALCQQLLDETAVGMAGPRTALGDAIGLGIQIFENSDAPTKTIIALTDGNDTDSPVPPVEAARVAKNRGITIHTVAMGDPATVGEEKLDEETLKAVAEMTGGDFFLAMNHGELTGIYDRLNQIETREVKTVSHRPRRDLYFWPLAVALLASLAANAWKLWAGRSAVATAPSTARLRVNARTFELEAVEQ
jgi:Ca-activated chloride channel family protein